MTRPSPSSKGNAKRRGASCFHSVKARSASLLTESRRYQVPFRVCNQGEYDQPCHDPCNAPGRDIRRFGHDIAGIAPFFKAIHGVKHGSQCRRPDNCTLNSHISPG
ncbi:hypothetical protein EMIT0111MI5_10089 [Burkholderia sp. IT-111MI5]